MANTPQVGSTIKGADGQLRVWVPDDRNSRNWEYLQQGSGFQSAEEAAQADIDSGQGSYVPASYVEHMPLALKAFIITGLVSAGIVTGGSLLAPGAFGGGAAAAGGGTAAATTSSTLGTNAMAGTTFAPWLGAGGGGAAAGGVGTGVGVGAGAGAGTGLTTMGTMEGIRRAGQVLLGGANSAAQGRLAEANLNLTSDQLRQRQAESERQAALDRAKLETDQRTIGQDLETQARKQAAWGNWMQTPRSPDNRPSYIPKLTTMYDEDPGANARRAALGDEAYRAAQLRLVSGSDKKFPELPKIPTPPLTPQPNESAYQKFLRYAGTGMSLYGAFSGYNPPTTRT